MSALEQVQRPPTTADAVWWAPHFNVPLRGTPPLIVTLHDLLPLRDVVGATSPLRRIVLRAWLRAIRRRALQVICVSQRTREDAIALGGLDAAKLHVVPLAAGNAWQPVEGRDGASPYIVFVGLLKPHKNLGLLLSAFASIADRVPHRLVVIGKHEGLRSIDDEALLQAHRLAPRVELHDWVSGEDLVRIVSRADLLVHPSLHEGFGLAPLEAMAAGVPVIASRTGATPEYGGDAIVYCDPQSPDALAAQMLEVLLDPGLRERMRARGIALARRYSWDDCANATTQVVAAAMEQAGEAA